MRLLPDAEQCAFTDSLHAMLSAARTPSVVRDWSHGDLTSGRALWRRLGQAGLFGLAAPEAYGGVGPHPVELALGCVEVGRHAVPGPVAETVGAAVLLAALDDPAPARRFLPAMVSGESPAALSLGAAYTLDADAAGTRLTVHSGRGRARQVPAGSPQPAGPAHAPVSADSAGSTEPNEPTERAERTGFAEPAERTGCAERARCAEPTDPTRSTRSTELRLAPPPRAPGRPSLDPARRLFPTEADGELLAVGPQVAAAAAQALTWARLVTAAQALGVGLALLDRTVAYVRRRTQFGAPVGSFQAVKHRLADAKTALEFARPLLYGAAMSLRPADVAAAKLTACEAAYATARAALHLHGAIGYTAEYDLSLWLTKARALRTAWGAPEECRELVLADRLGTG